MPILFRLTLAFSCLASLPAAADDPVEPLPFHELGEASADVPVPWAVPLAGGSIRALAVAPYGTLGDFVQLQGHIELDLETTAVWDRDHLGSDPRFPKPRYPDAAYEAVEKRLTRLLDRKKLDVIILGQCNPAMFPAPIQQQIIDRVEGGAGLLIAGGEHYARDGGPLAEWLRAAPEVDAPPRLSSGVGPLGLGDETAELLATCRTAGEGRIALLNMGQSSAPNHCLVPVPADPFALIPEHEANAYSLICRAIQWLATGAPPARISHVTDIAPQGPVDEEIPPGYPQEFVESVRSNAFSGPLRPYMLHLEAPATDSYEVVYQLRVPGTAIGRIVQQENATLPKGAQTYAFDIIASPGSYLLDVWLKNRKGIVTWHTETITVAGWPRIESLTITQNGKDAVWLHPNDHLDVNVDIESGEALTARTDATVYARALDSFGRQVAERVATVKSKGGVVSLRLDLADLIAPLVKVEVFAVPSGAVNKAMLVNQSAREIFYFPVRFPEPVLEPTLILSAGGPFDYRALRQLDYLRREFGAGVLHTRTGSDSLLASGKTGLARIAQVGTFDRGRVGEDATRLPCLSSPAHAERERQTIEAGVLGAWAGGAPFYSLGADFALTGTDANVCQSPDCLAHFHAYLQRTYDSLESLNQAWDASYARWDEVRPAALYACQQSRRWAPWLDFRLSMNEVMARAPQQSRNAVHAIDPAGRVGFQAPGTILTPLAGYDWRQLCNAVDFIAAPPSGTAMRRLQTYHRGHAYAGILLGEDQLRSDPAWIRWVAWNSLLRQLPALWLDRPIGAGAESLVAPLGQAKPGLAALGEVWRTIQDGVGTLLLNAVPQETGIAFVDSPASAFLDFADPEPGRTAEMAETWLENALNQMGFAAGVRSLAEPLPGINTLLLSRTRSLSDAEVATLEEFHKQNGLILADGRPGTFDGHGTPRAGTPLPFLHPLDPDHPEDEFSLWTNRPVWVRQIGDDSGNKEILAELLKRAGNAPAAPVDLPRKLAGDLTRFQYRYGAATIIACLAGPDAASTARRARMELPDGHHGTHLLQIPEIEPRGHVQWTVDPGQPAIFSILPYEVEELRVQTPERATAGTRLPLEIKLDTGDVAPGKHLLQVQLFDPNGDELLHYRRCIPMENALANTYLPLAENETPGFYTLSVRDILSRTEVALQVEII